ncbi:MAG: alpha/beta hydrolase [Acidimicrobiales bacterium]
MATLVRHTAVNRGDLAVLYLHGFNDYFFQVALARWFVARGIDFYALDMRKYGRSLLPHQTANFCRDLAEYDPDLEAAAQVVAADGHRRLLLVAHSTGGLVAPLWAARGTSLPAGLTLVGMVLNSPFLELPQSPALRAAMTPLLRGVSSVRPTTVLPLPRGSYGETIHASTGGEWDYSLDWKPLRSFPVRVGWLSAVLAGQRVLQRGLDIRQPALVLLAGKAAPRQGSVEEAGQGDAVLDPDALARTAHAVSRHLTLVRLEGAIHDVFLSPEPARDRAYATLGSWLEAWIN